MRLTEVLHQALVLALALLLAIGTAAAIGNAVTNAVGARVNKFPMSPKNVLDAIANAAKTEGKA